MVECRTRKKLDGSNYKICYNGTKKAKNNNTSLNNIMQRKIVEKKIQREDERIKNLLAGLDATTSAPIRGVPKGGLLERKLKAKAKERDSNVKLVGDMVKKQRTAKKPPPPPKKKAASPAASPAASASESDLRTNLETKTTKEFQNLPQMYVVISKGDKYLDARTPKGNPIKIEQRATYKSKSAAISMLVMPKDGNNLMVKAGKKKGNNFTLALSKLEAGIKKGTMELKKVKPISTKEWEGSHTMPDGKKMKGTKEAVHSSTPKKPATPKKRIVGEARSAAPSKPSEGVPYRTPRKSGY